MQLLKKVLFYSKYMHFNTLLFQIFNLISQSYFFHNAILNVYDDNLPLILGPYLEGSERIERFVCFFFLYGQCPLCIDCILATTEQGQPSL